ncbi:hypothetical protein BDN67DRAFT_916363, partial [Paxillus ammoniavirescens]
GFHDITSDTNPGCGTLSVSTAGGWDPVNDLGTPNLPALLDKWPDIHLLASWLWLHTWSSMLARNWCKNTDCNNTLPLIFRAQRCSSHFPLNIFV